MGNRKFFTLSYDDGVEQDKRFIELLKKYGIKCTFCINSGLFGEKDYLIRSKDKNFRVAKHASIFPKKFIQSVEHFKIPRDEIKDVYAGFEVASHGVKHKDMSLISKKRRKQEILNDKQELEKILGYTIKGHIFPYGIYTKDALDILKECDVKYTRSIKSTNSFSIPDDKYFFHPTCWHGDENIMVLLDEFIKAEPEEDILFNLWGHTYEFDYGTERNSWKRIEEILEKISSMENIINCTNSEMVEAISKDH